MATKVTSSEANLVATVTKIGQALPGVAAGLPKGVDAKHFNSESQRLTGTINTVDKVNLDRAKAIAAKKQQAKSMRDLMKRIRSSVKGHFGDDSLEYEAVGGKRASNRKKPVRKPKSDKKTA